LVFLHD